MARGDRIRPRDLLSDQRLPGETALGHFLRDAVCGMLIGLPQFMTPFIIVGALHGASDMPGPLREALAKYPPLTARQIEAYCVKERAEWTLPWWHDPVCGKYRPPPRFTF